MTRPAAYDRDVLLDVLVYHQPTATSGCICGWAELGRSHAVHVADAYEVRVAAPPTMRVMRFNEGTAPS